MPRVRTGHAEDQRGVGAPPDAPASSRAVCVDAGSNAMTGTSLSVESPGRAGREQVSWGNRRTAAVSLTVGLIAAAAAFALQLGHGAPWPVVAGDQLVGLSYLIAGTIAWLRRPANRIGPTIAGAGVTWFIADFVLVPIAGISALAYAVMWVPVLFDAFLLLAYPTGRFFSSTARRLFVLSAAVSIVQYAVRLVLLQTTPDYGCVCLNPFALLPNVGLYDAVMLVNPDPLGRGSANDPWLDRSAMEARQSRWTTSTHPGPLRWDRGSGGIRCRHRCVSGRQRRIALQWDHRLRARSCACRCSNRISPWTRPDSARPRPRRPAGRPTWSDAFT
jgi:hypothetical protein